jgi:hypothetical protein
LIVEIRLAASHSFYQFDYNVTVAVYSNYIMPIKHWATVQMGDKGQGQTDEMPLEPSRE